MGCWFGEGDEGEGDDTVDGISNGIDVVFGGDDEVTCILHGVCELFLVVVHEGGVDTDDKWESHAEDLGDGSGASMGKDSTRTLHVGLDRRLVVVDLEREGERLTRRGERSQRAGGRPLLDHYPSQRGRRDGRRKRLAVDTRHQSVELCCSHTYKEVRRRRHLVWVWGWVWVGGGMGGELRVR